MKHDREYPGRPIVGVGGVVVSNERALLVRRGKPPLEDKWSIPGGMLELGETLQGGLRRELAEETGIDVRVLDMIEVFERISLDDTGQTKYHFVVLDYLCEAVGGDARAASDANEVAWAAESELGQYQLEPSAERVVKKALEMARKRVDRSIRR